MRKRVLTSAISFILICSLFTSFALAATLRASEYISAYNAVIYSSDNEVTVDCTIVGTDEMKTIGIKTVKIYSSSGTNVATRQKGMSILWEATLVAKQHPSHIRAFLADPIMRSLRSMPLMEAAAIQEHIQPKLSPYKSPFGTLGLNQETDNC